MKPELDVPTYSIRDVCAAARISVSALDKWKQNLPLKKLLTASDVPGSRGRGKVAQYSLRSAYRIALMAEATRNRVSPDVALKTVFKFTDDGDDKRPACEPFSNGSTYLVFHDTKEIGRLINPENENTMLVKDPYASAILIDCEVVLSRTRGALPKVNQ